MMVERLMLSSTGALAGTSNDRLKHDAPTRALAKRDFRGPASHTNLGLVEALIVE
jgi:hypothetical protein